MPPGSQGPEHLHHHSAYASCGEEQQHLIDTDSLGEMLLTALRQVDGRVGRRMASEPFPPAAGTHILEPCAQLILQSCCTLVGRRQVLGGTAEGFQLAADLRLQPPGGFTAAVRFLR